MKKRKGNYLLSYEEFMLLQTAAIQYMEISEYIRKTLLQRELLSTQQIAKKYCISRQTIYRNLKTGALLPVIKHRSYYFDPDEVKAFFLKYRKIG